MLEITENLYYTPIPESYSDLCYYDKHADIVVRRITVMCRQDASLDFCYWTVEPASKKTSFFRNIYLDPRQLSKEMSHYISLCYNAPVSIIFNDPAIH